MEKVYKVFVIEDGILKTLFRGIEGSREIRFDRWLEAKEIMSVDGSGQDEYLTGIHVFKDRNKAINYLDNFRNEDSRVVIPCFADKLREKPTNSDVYLANQIYVPKEFIDVPESNYEKYKEVISIA